MRPLPRTVWLSLGVHAVLMGMLAIALMETAPVPVKPPGTRHGTMVMLYYTPGSAKASPARAAARATPRPALLPAPALATAAKPKPQKQATQTPVQADSALGSGDIEMALLTYGPDPKPDLSTLPAGASGDVVLEVTIDEHGRVAHVSLLKGLGDSVDQAVIATAEQWTFSPATRDGVPVASSQQLLFHYGRS